MDNAQRFLNAFAMIEKQLKQITGVTRYSRFYQLLNQASRSSGLVRKYEMELQEYADLRNAIVHQRSDEGHIIAIPIDEVVADIEELARKICEPPKVSAHFLKPVKICDPQTEIREAVDIMETMGSSKLPVYAQGGFHALLTMEMIARWTRHQSRTNQPLSGVVSDCLYFKDKKERVLFLPRTADVTEAQDLFEASLHRGVSISAILITESGSAHQKPIGIITVADLPLLYELDK